MASTEIGNDGWAATRHGNWRRAAAPARWERETLGPCPASEDCAQLGEPDYEARAKAECRRYIDTIRAAFGHEPAGARLAVRSHRHDFGFYYEVEISWEVGNEVAEAYAARACDPDELPGSWGSP